jgi:ketosteroid isomerase-like protein
MARRVSVDMVRASQIAYPRCTMRCKWSEHTARRPLEAAPHDWAGVEGYYKNVAAFVEWVKTMRVSDLSVDVFGDMAYAFCHVHAEVGFKGQSQPLSLDARATFILRRKGGAWKVIHYHESRPHLPTG